MIRAMYTATSGMMMGGGEKFDMLANNLANVNTAGFRAQYLSQVSVPQTKDPKSASPTDVQVTYSQPWFNPAPGQLQFTGQDTDIAVQGGKAFFTVRTPSQQIAYTRNGQFRKNAQGHLLDVGGNAVMGEKGPIVVPSTAEKFTVDQTGNVSADGVPVGKLALVEFPEGTRPRPAGGGIFFAEEGQTPVASKDTVLQGYFEHSNVNVVDEMIRLIDSVRSMESYQKVLLASSEDTTAQLVRQTGRVG